MKSVKIVIVTCDVPDVRVWGEVKAVEVASFPTIAHAEATAAQSDTFLADTGRHMYQCRVSRKCRVTLSTEIDGVMVGPPVALDATAITAGHRYPFKVPA